MKNQRWRKVAWAGVSVGALAVLVVPGCGSSDSGKKVGSTFHPDAGNSAGESGESSGGSGASGGTAPVGGNSGTNAAGEGGVTGESGATGAAEGGAAGDGTGLTGCALGDACCASNSCESGLNCLGSVCSCVAALSNQYMVRTDGVAFFTVQNDTAQSLVVNADTGMALHGIVSIMGTNYHGCAALDTGEVRCWPLVSDATGNNSGQLGNGTIGGTYPVLVGALVKVSAGTNLSAAVSVGSDADTYGGTTTTCAATKTGSAYCWGNAGPKVVNAATTNTAFATQIKTAAAGPALTGVTQVTVGNAHACALTNGKVRCWGSIDGTNVTHAYPDTDIVGIPGTIQKVAAGYWYTCALTDASGGSVYCWGDNNGNKLGQGLGAGANSPTPLRVKTSAAAFLDGAIDLAVAYGGACVVRTDHTIYCWGGNVTGGFATERKNSMSVNITDAVTVSTAAGPDDPRYISESGVYWNQNTMITPNCGIVE